MTGDTLLTRKDFKPGFNRNTTPYSAENYWVDGDKVRFKNGNPEKIGGWVRESVSQTFTGVVRDIKSWKDLNNNRYFAAGSHKKIELFADSEIYDITPYRKELTLTDVISTTLGSSVVTISDTNHNLKTGDYVYVDSQATPVDGITLSGEYTVQTVIDANSYTLDTGGTTATGTSTNSGGTLKINYLLETGYESNGNITGYGGGGYGEDTYGTERTGVGGTYLRQWSLDNWGEDLLACVRGGKVYHWDATLGVGYRMTQVTNAPTENFIVLVSQPSRHLCVFGTQLASTGVFDPLNIRWASQETLTEWAIVNTNTAGEYRLSKGNKIEAVIQTKNEILILTDTTLYSMRYVGGSSVFQFDIIGSNISVISQHCCVDVNGTVYWLGLDGFYKYDGLVHKVYSSVSEFYLNKLNNGILNFEQKEKVYCALNKEFNEVIWFVPTKDSSNEITRYVIYNYLENVWYDGSLKRTVWLDKGIFEKPYAISPEGVLYVHEEGKDADGSVLEAYLKSGDVDLADGQDLMFIDMFVPDFKLITNRNIQLYLHLKKWPNSTAIIKGPYTFNNETEKISLRAKGRHVAIEYRANTLGADFIVGSPRFAIQPDGGR